MAFTMEDVILATKDCDERIANTLISYEESKKMKQLYLQIKLLLEEIKEDYQIIDAHTNTILCYECTIKMIRIEKMIYIALLKKGNNEIFSKLLYKYDELLRSSYELTNGMVQDGAKESLYLNYCTDSLGQRKYIKTLCDYGLARK